MNDPVLQEIKDRLNVADVLASYIQVKRAGTAFKAACPFHSEKTASLMISPQKQIWHCFGCGLGGDIFGFVMRYENVDFKEALKILANRAGVQLPVYSRQNVQEASEKELLLKINNFAAEFYHRVLTKDKRGKPALDYLHERGLKDSTIKQWQIGFAPQDAHSLENALKTKKVNPADLIKAGVSAKNERGNYERFYGRITFPVFGYMGECVGFSARVLPAATNPAKYINSPETLIYHKSKILFGLNFAKNAIRKQDEAIIVEGQMDCIMAHQAGFVNVVASSGTALTPDQLQLLGRITNNINFAFDADSAGQAASIKAENIKTVADLIQKQNAVNKGNSDLFNPFRIKIIVFEGAKDVDELIKKDPQLFKQAIEKAALFLDFLFKVVFKKYPGVSIDEKKGIMKELLPHLKDLPDPMEQDHYLKILSDRLETPPKILWESLDKIKSMPIPSAIHQKSSFMPVRQTGTDNLEKEILGGMLMFESFLSFVKQKGSADDFENYEVKSLLAPVFEPDFSGRLAADSTLAKEAVFMVESELKESEGNEGALLRQLRKSFAVLKLQSLRRAQQRLNFEIKKAESLGDKSEVKNLNQKFVQVAAQRNEFEKQV